MSVSKTIEVGKGFISLCQSITESVEEKIHSPSKLHRQSEISELNGFIESINSCLENAKACQKLNPSKRELRKAVKTLSSLCDGLEDKELGVGEYRSHLDNALTDSIALAYSNTTDVLSKLVSDTDEDSDKETSLSKLIDLGLSSKSGDISAKDVLARYRDEYKKTFDESTEEESVSGESGDGYDLRVVHEQESDAKAKVKLSKYSRYSRKLPRNVKMFDVVEVPIVPIFKDFNLMSEKTLNKTSIKYTKLGQHLTVFENQIILAFNRSAITKGRNTPKSRQAQARLSGEYDKFVMELIDTINERSTVKYTLASKKYLVSRSNKNIMFVWLMPVNQMARLRQSANDSKGIELESWDFPWTV